MSHARWYTSSQSKISDILLEKEETQHNPAPLMSLIFPNNLDKAKVKTIPNQEELYAALYAIPELDVLLDYSLDAALTIAAAQAGSLFLWDERQKELVLKSARGPYRERLRNVHVKLREGILGWVSEGGQAVLVQDIHEDNRFRFLLRRGNYQSNSFMSIPLIAENRLIGVINITEREDRSPFQTEELHQVQIFARHLALAYEKLHLVQRLRKENEELHQGTLELKKSLKQQEPLVAVGKLATNLAHELNNPLDAIRRYVNLALDQAMEDSLTREYLLKAKTGIRRAVRVIRGLLQFSRSLRNAETRGVEIHSLIERGLAAIQSEPAFQQIKIEKMFCGTSAYVTDSGLPVAFHNLFRNAQQAMDGKGTLSVSTSLENGSVQVAVQDTGCGIETVDLPHIFDPFFSTKEQGEGMGIGLTICREIIEKCGGKITCENVPTRGARFVITLPCRRELRTEIAQ